MTIGVMFNTDRLAGEDLVSFARRVEEAGIDTMWVPELFGREPIAAAAWLLAATDRLRVATGIANVYAVTQLLQAPQPELWGSSRAIASCLDLECRTLAWSGCVAIHGSRHCRSWRRISTRCKLPSSQGLLRVG